MNVLLVSHEHETCLEFADGTVVDLSKTYVLSLSFESSDYVNYFALLAMALSLAGHGKDPFHHLMALDLLSCLNTGYIATIPKKPPILH